VSLLTPPGVEGSFSVIVAPIVGRDRTPVGAADVPPWTRRDQRQYLQWRPAGAGRVGRQPHRWRCDGVVSAAPGAASYVAQVPRPQTALACSTGTLTVLSAWASSGLPAGFREYVRVACRERL
jgi:hypothetical protein